MISEININNFKCFKDQHFSLSNFNLLTGTNSGGKSSLIQALLLISQNQTSKTCILNGSSIKLGEFGEIKNFDISQDNNIKLEIENDDGEKILIEINRDLKFINNKKDFNLILDENVFYLSAGRYGSSDTYEDSQDNIKFGKFGEYAISYLYQHKDVEVPDNFIFDKNTERTLDYQVNYWLNKILGEQISVTKIDKTSKLVATYSNTPNKFTRNSNTGSGISYLISILILTLGCSLINGYQNFTILLENPEIHLHPKAQSELAEFLMFISKNYQLIIETHSDHIFNAYRIALKNENISLDNSKVYFFKYSNNRSVVNRIEFTKHGKILTKEQGLFDQFDIDLFKMV